MTTATPKPIADYQKKRAHRDRGMAPDGAKGLAMLARWSCKQLLRMRNMLSSNDRAEFHPAFCPKSWWKLCSCSALRRGGGGSRI